jgi:hypothetical protein
MAMCRCHFSADPGQTLAQSLTILVPSPGVYRIAYSESGNRKEIGSIFDLASGSDRFSVGSDEPYIGRVEMRDFGDDSGFSLEAWGIFFIVLGILAFLLFCLGIVVFWKYRYVRQVEPSRRCQ